MRFIILLLFMMISATLFSETSKRDTLLYLQLTQHEKTDTITYYRELEEIDVYPRPVYKINFRRYSRLVKKIRKVYPFAVEAAAELEVYNEKYKEFKTERERRKYVRQVEKELFAKHEDEFKHFTISEGRYLMLLIDRETGETSYDLIKELKGTFPALFWQGFALIFGNDLKEDYDPYYKHFMIEQIVLMIKAENKGNNK
jgi:hypothetical protein